MEKENAKKTARITFLIISVVFLVYVFYAEDINNWWAVLPGVVVASALWHFMASGKQS